MGQIQAMEDPQPSVQKKVLKRPKTRRNRTKHAEQVTKEAHATLSCVVQGEAAPRNTILREALYKYSSNLEAKGQKHLER